MAEPPKKRQLQKAQTHRLILETAYALFEEKGYAKTTMRGLANRAGIGLGTIFQHFPDKPSLLVAAFEVDIEQVVADAMARLPSSGLRQQLLHLVGCLFAYYQTRPGLSQVLLQNILFLEGSAGQTLEGLVGNFLAEVAQLVIAAQKRGEISCNFKVHTFIVAFWSFYTMCLVGLLKYSQTDLEEHLEIFGQLIDQHLLLSEQPTNGSPP